MGLFDMFRADPDQVETTRSALEAAQDPRRDDGPIQRVMEILFDTGLDGRGPVRSAEQVAARARRGNGTTDDAIAAVARGATVGAAVGGFVTGVGGFVTMPVALPANLLEFYVQATRMVGAIATLRGYDLTDERIRTAVMLTLVGSKSEEVLRKAGISSASARFATVATRGLPPAALMVLNKAIGFNLMRGIGLKALGGLGRGVPVVGGLLGGGLDAWMMKRIADHALTEFPPVTDGGTPA